MITSCLSVLVVKSNGTTKTQRHRGYTKLFKVGTLEPELTQPMLHFIATHE
jgi:hypothetical protein